ncbi:MAG: phasin family protein [Burkholderiales bacterium]
MNNFAEQMNSVNKAFVEASVRLAKTSFENSERLVALNVEAAKHSFDESTKSIKALNDVKDPQDLLAIRAKLTESAVEKASGYTRHLLDLAAEAQAEFTKLAEDNWAQLNKNLNASVDQMSKSAPAGSEVVFNALKSGLVAGSSAIENVSKASKQFAGVAQANFKAAAQQAANATVKGRKAK